MEDKPGFILLLEFLESKGIGGVTWNQTVDWAIRERIILSRDGCDAMLLSRLFGECTGLRSHPHEDASRNLVLSAEFHSRLVDYRELQLARQSAQQARTQSNRALMVSVGAILISAVIGVGQLFYPVSIDTDQLDNLHQTIQQAHSKQAPNPAAKLNSQAPATEANKAPQTTGGDVVKAHSEQSIKTVHSASSTVKLQAKQQPSVPLHPAPVRLPVPETSALSPAASK